MPTVTGEIKSKSRAGTGIVVDGVEGWMNGEKDVLNAVSFKDIAEVTYEETKTKSGKPSMNVTSVTKVNGPATPSSTNAKDGYQERQDSILWQSARKDAVHIVDVMLRHDLVAIPKVKKDQYDAVIGLVNNVTRSFYDTSKSFQDED